MVTPHDPKAAAWADRFHVLCALLLMVIGVLVMGGVGLYALVNLVLTEFHPKAMLVLSICGFVFFVPALYLFHVGWRLLRQTRKVPGHPGIVARP